MTRYSSRPTSEQANEIPRYREIVPRKDLQIWNRDRDIDVEHSIFQYAIETHAKDRNQLSLDYSDVKIEDINVLVVLGGSN